MIKHPKFPGVDPYEAVSLPYLLDGPLEIDWLVNGLIPPITSTIMAGDSGVGKTWLLLDLILSIASGEPWLGRFEVKQGPVLVIDEENADLLLRIRLNNLIKFRGIDISPNDLPIYFVVGQMAHLSPEKDSSGNMVSSEPFKKIWNTIYKLKPILTTFDSLTRVHRHNEMYAGDMALVFSQVKMLMDDLDTAIVVTHHFTKSGKNGDGARIRGSGDIRAFADTTILIEQAEGGIAITHDKSRWAEPITPFGAKIISEGGNVGVTCDDDVKLGAKELIDIWQWLKGKLIDGPLSRKEIIAQGKIEIERGQRAIDTVLSYRFKNKDITKETQGREVTYSLAVHESEQGLLETIRSPDTDPGLKAFLKVAMA